MGQAAREVAVLRVVAGVEGQDDDRRLFRQRQVDALRQAGDDFALPVRCCRRQPNGRTATDPYRRNELVALAARHAQVARTARLVAQRAPQQQHPLAHRLGRHQAAAPDPFGQFVVAEQPGRGLHQRQQQLVGQLRQGDALQAAEHGALARVERQVREFEEGMRARVRRRRRLRRIGHSRLGCRRLRRRAYPTPGQSS